MEDVGGDAIGAPGGGIGSVIAQQAKRNIELKARCADLARARRAAEESGARRLGLLVQTDTYFRVPNGRLKLRETEGRADAELIWYVRADSVEFRGSDYFVLPIPQPAETKAALTAALGVRGVVRKRRELWMWHGSTELAEVNVRIHLDEVEGLGSFIEFEAVISDEASEALSLERLEKLSQALHIDRADRIAASYSDLLHL